MLCFVGMVYVYAEMLVCYMHNNMFIPLSRITCLCGKEIGCLTSYVIMHIEDWKSLFVPQWNQMTPKTQKHVVQ